MSQALAVGTMWVAVATPAVVQILKQCWPEAVTAELFAQD